MDLHGRVQNGSFQALTQDPMTEKQARQTERENLPP